MPQLHELLQIYALAGRSGRIVGALILLASGLGRLGLIATSLSGGLFGDYAHGVLLTLGGLAVLLTTPWRLRPLGRACAAGAALLVAGMIWEVHVFSVTVLVWAIVCAALVGESLTSRADY